MDKEIDHEYTHQIVCPYCGYEFSDSWEFGTDKEEYLGEMECGECEKTFTASRRCDITYVTQKIESKEAK